MPSAGCQVAPQNAHLGDVSLRLGSRLLIRILPVASATNVGIVGVHFFGGKAYTRSIHLAYVFAERSFCTDAAY